MSGERKKLRVSDLTAAMGSRLSGLDDTDLQIIVAFQNADPEMRKWILNFLRQPSGEQEASRS